jgi:tRNA nucleotidyltransferase/poly(A) polymerase
MQTNIKNRIPRQILDIVETLQKSGFEAQIVGGSVRDLLLGLNPKDWDINTNALPQDILSLFPDSFYENEFGTVGVKIRKLAQTSEGEAIVEETEIVEVTPYRKEGKYSDGRHPESVSFDATLSDDLQRRDFTVNAIAYNPTANSIKDMSSVWFSIENKDDIENMESIKDIKDKLLRAVGAAEKRFKEDYLRMMRAVRLV